MSWSRSFAALALVFLVSRPASAAPASSESPGSTPVLSVPDLALARHALDEVRLAYRREGAFRETINLTLTLPDGRHETRRTEYGVDAAGSALLVLSHAEGEVIRIVAQGERMIGTEVGNKARYAEAAYHGDFAAALRALGGDQAQMAAPPRMVGCQGGDLDAFLNAFRMGALGPLRIVGFHPVAGEGKAALLRIDLQAENGQMVVGLDPQEHRLLTLDGTVGDGAQRILASAVVTPAAGAGSLVAEPDLAGRTAVATLGGIEESSFPLGQPAPDVAFRSLDGRMVHPNEFAGSVVVVDFWATWCIPCWTALGHTAEIAEWVRSSRLPVKVFAVDTLESDTTFETQQQRVSAFLHSKGIDVPALLDLGGKGFVAFHNPGLPSLVILDREGHLVRYHSGLLQDFVATVRGELTELLNTSKGTQPAKNDRP